MKNTVNTICVFLILIILSDGGWDFPWNNIAPSKADTVAVVYESADNIPEPYVTGALNQLVSEGLQARVFDKDVVNGNQQVPAQLKEAIKAANNNGLPALVILSKGKVIKVQDLPKTESEIIEATK